MCAIGFLKDSLPSLMGHLMLPGFWLLLACYQALKYRHALRLHAVRGGLYM